MSDTILFDFNLSRNRAMLRSETQENRIDTGTVNPSSTAQPEYLIQVTETTDASKSEVTVVSSYDNEANAVTNQSNNRSNTTTVEYYSDTDQDKLINQLADYVRCHTEINTLEGAISGGVKDNIELKPNFDAILKKLDTQHLENLCDFLEGRKTYPGIISLHNLATQPATMLTVVAICMNPTFWPIYVGGAVGIGLNQVVHRWSSQKRCQWLLEDVKRLIPDYQPTIEAYIPPTAKITNYVGSFFTRKKPEVALHSAAEEIESMNTKASTPGHSKQE